MKYSHCDYMPKTSKELVEILEDNLIPEEAVIDVTKLGRSCLATKRYFLMEREVYKNTKLQPKSYPSTDFDSFLSIITK